MEQYVEIAPHGQCYDSTPATTQKKSILQPS